LDHIKADIAGPLARFLSYDEQTEEVFVHGLAKHNIGDSLPIGARGPDNRIKAAARLVEAIHSDRLARAFLDRYGISYHLAGARAHTGETGFEAPSEGLKEEAGGPSKPIEVPAKPLRSPFEAIAVQSKARQFRSIPSESGGARQGEEPGISREALLGFLRKLCAGRDGRISEASMRTNASCVDTLAKRHWTYADIHRAVSGTRTLIDRGTIPSIRPGIEWTLRVLTDADPVVDPMQRGFDAYGSLDKPVSSRLADPTGTSKLEEVLDFSRFARET
jgi:hypothetical protein